MNISGSLMCRATEHLHLAYYYFCFVWSIYYIPNTNISEPHNTMLNDLKANAMRECMELYYEIKQFLVRPGTKSIQHNIPIGLNKFVVF